MFQRSVAVLDGRFPFCVEEAEQRRAAKNCYGYGDEESRLVVECQENGNAVRELEGEHPPHEVDCVVQTVGAEENPRNDDDQQGVEEG